MTNPRHGAGDLGPGGSTPGPSSFPASADSLSFPPALFAAAAADVFGDRLGLAGRYVELLATDGVVRGLIGPREAPRLWERHLINCGVMSQIIPFGASVVDVGSGAGLPGIVLAVARPDLQITLVEPLARRTAFLDEAVDLLGLDSVTVVRGRAEEAVGHVEADIVTARAVAALDKLAGWCLPLAKVGGRLLALKGASAADEVAAHQDVLTELGGGESVVRLCGVGLIDPPATVVEVVRERVVAVRGSAAPRGGSRGGSRSDESRGGAERRGGSQAGGSRKKTRRR